MKLGLENKVALVTAASKGIGLGTAKALTQEGCRVVICSRSREELDKAKSSIDEATKNEGKVLAIPADLSSEEDIERLVSETQRQFGAIDILAYNTGSPKVAGFLQLSNEDWDQG